MDDCPTADDVSGVYDFEEYEVAESESSEPRDRLSELPESLILLILSFLPMRSVVRTTLLSKRWKDLWITVPCLDFSDDINDSGRLQDFVNRALILWKGTKILKFKIDFLFDMSLSSDLDLWVHFAMENNVEELYIGLMYDDEDVIMSREDAGYQAPLCLYSCSSIRKLTIYCGNLKIHGDLQWNQLKVLRIECVCLSEHVVNQVLSGTPQLEVLKLSFMESYENLNIQSNSLKKLTIHKDLYLDDDPAMATVLKIWAPNLESLMISGVLYSKCLLMNISSLTDATFVFYPKDDNGNELLREMLRQIFPTIHHAEKVTLSGLCIEAIGVMEKKYLLSSSSDVKFLKLNASFGELDKIVDLLEIFPKLKMLAIEQNFREKHFLQEQHVREPLEFDAETKSFLLQLRTVEITWSLCDTSIFPFIEFILKHASMLEKMVIRARRITSLAPESFSLASQKLLRMPRSSPVAEVILCKHNHHQVIFRDHNDIILFE